MENEECMIVYDLLPLYIDDLTSEISNQYIERHLESCEKCKKALEDMTCKIELEKEEIEPVEIILLKELCKRYKQLKYIVLIF